MVVKLDRCESVCTIRMSLTFARRSKLGLWAKKTKNKAKALKTKESFASFHTQIELKVYSYNKVNLLL